MFNFTIQNNQIHSDITGALADPAIIVSIDKETNAVTFQKVGEYDHLKDVVIPKYDLLRSIYTTVLLALDTMPIHPQQQCILLNHITNVSLSPLSKQFVAQLFSNDVDGCRETVNNMYRANKQVCETDGGLLHDQITVTHTRWEQAFYAYKMGTYTNEDIAILVQAGLNIFDGSSRGDVARQTRDLFNKACRNEPLSDYELTRIQTYYKTLAQEKCHTEVQATEIYTNIDYVLGIAQQ